MVESNTRVAVTTVSPNQPRATVRTAARAVVKEGLPATKQYKQQ